MSGPAGRLRAMLTPRLAVDGLYILAGALIQAAGMRLFLIPANLVAGGVSGLSQLINHFNGWPVGLMILAGNVPLFFIGWRYLGGPRFALRTALTLLFYSGGIDLLEPYFPAGGITDDLLLNALYGGAVTGIGAGLVYRGRGTSGGTDILARIIAHQRGIPVSQTYMLTDAAVMLTAGLVFGWENALYAIAMLYISGLAAETVLQGARVVRTALIITSQPEAVSAGILHELQRGLTRLDGQGVYTGEARAVLYCVVSRAEVERLKVIVAEADPAAFVVIGQAYEALGEGFEPMSRQ
ncbi:MAG: YitT family protein [Chloroflexi bacterium]|nr:YitT family protein [Chloroflexota bacterium]